MKKIKQKKVSITELVDFYENYYLTINQVIKNKLCVVDEENTWIMKEDFQKIKVELK